MRITVKLGHFFHDHRAIARILLDDRIKSIQDVISRISHIFNIENFYLKCDNHYLPSSESADLLTYDDVVWAIPLNIHNVKLLEDPCIPDSQAEEQEKKKKKKRRHDEFSNDKQINHDDTPNQEYELKRKKKKNRDIDASDKNTLGEAETVFQKKRRTKDNKEQNESKKKKVEIDAYSDENMPEEVETALQKKKRPKDKKERIEEHEFKDSGCDSHNCETEMNNVHVKCMVNCFENRKFDYREKVQKMLQPDIKFDKNRINIVKTIIVSSTPSQIDSVSLENFSTEASTVDLNLEKCDKNDKMEDCSDISPIEHKRKRKRVRKRKSQKKESERLDVPMQSSSFKLIPRPLLTQTPGLHIRFDGEVPKINTVLVNGDGCTAKETLESTENKVEVESTQDCSSEVTTTANKIVTDDDDVINSDKPIQSSDQIYEEVESSQNYEITEEFILKHSITPNIEPRIGEIIAFKVLRISESYTPEVSSSIVGKVLFYANKSKQVMFRLIYGHDQCSLPQGKFCLDPEEDPDVAVSTTKMFMWSALLEPRLLFP